MPASVFRRELRELFRLALPLAAAQAGTQLMGLVDVAVLGRLGASELAGAGMANAVFFAVSVFGMGMMLGVDPLIAQAVGAGDHARARHVLWQGIWLSILVSGALTVVLLAASLAVPLIGASPDIVGHARAFLLVRTASLLPFLMFFVIRAYLQAHHVTRPMLVAMVVANIFNFALDLVFVFGVGDWIPAMGVAGAALATVICTFLELAIVAAAVRKMDAAKNVDHRPERAAILQAARIGAPIALHMGAEVGIFALVALLAGRLGTLHLAAHQLVIGIASFTFTVAVGVASAGSVRVGNAIGARDSAATRVAGNAAFIGGLIVMGVSATVFALAPGALARLFTNQPSVIAAAIPLMMVAAVFQLSDGIQAVGAGVLRGAGDTKYTFYANLVGHWLIGFPLALWLGFSRGLGIVGLWWGLCVGLTVVAVLLFVRFEKLSRGAIAPIAH
ncbi:MAG TPA: MATE family efflux transporter [Thermoanaerobaculia bacterium]|jgi:MATE family multidrug resistance protein|nr:MATE family efflux transporter [Thermoanaerobaculia bacterium]